MLRLINKKVIILLLVPFFLLGLTQSVQAVFKLIGETATITVTCSDSDGNLSECNVTVTSPCTKNCSASGSSGSCSCQFICSSVENYDACGEAKDQAGGSDLTCLPDEIQCVANRPPDKPDIPDIYKPSGVSWSHCLFQEVSLPTFHWTYSDYDDVPPGTDSQTAYEIRIDNDSDFSVIDGDEYKCGGAICSGGASQAFTPIPSEWADWMDWNRNYWWIARVKDNHNNWSLWSAVNPFTTPLHAYSWPDFTHQPPSPAANEEVSFTDQSTCYEASGNSYPCQNKVNNRYQWDFEDDGAIDCDSNLNVNCRGNTTTTYSSPGNYTTRLYVSDELGTCQGTGDTPVITKFPLPEYKEVPPFFWLKKIFAAVVEFFDGFLKPSNAQK